MTTGLAQALVIEVGIALGRGRVAVAQDAGIIPREGDEALLNGPALADDENVVSQDDIDSLFA